MVSSGGGQPAGTAELTADRASVQTSVFVEQDGRWLVAAFHNTRQEPRGSAPLARGRDPSLPPAGPDGDDSGVASATDLTQQSIPQRIADELGVRTHQVSAAVGLLDDGSTVPFIARYRKEATGALDDAQLRTLEERLRYLRELEDRRAAVLDEIRKQGKLDAGAGGADPGRRVQGPAGGHLPAVQAQAADQGA